MLTKKKSKLPAWDLTKLYKSQKDPQINKDLESSFRSAQKFARTYENKVYKLNAKKLSAVLNQLEQIEEKASLPIIYANLLFAESATVIGANGQSRGAFVQEVTSKYSQIRKELLFFEVELSNLPEKTLKNLIKDKSLSNYKNYLTNLLLAKPYRLPTNVEKIITDKELSGRNSWIRLFDEEFANKTFLLNKTTLSESQVLSKLYSANRKDRILAAQSLTNGLKEESRRLTYIFNTLMLDKQSDDQIRNFQRPEDSRHLANQITHETVESMCQAVEEAYSCVQDYYRLKKKKLKLSALYDYDRYAPIAKTTTVIPLERAKELVLESFYGFSPQIGKIAEMFFTKNWIDFEQRPGKRGGAFCSFVTPKNHPVVFMNYHGSIRDVFTLAHELGHAVHAYLMRKQSLLNFDTPLTIAETASVFAEMLLFEKLALETKSKEEKFALYAGKLENIFATVFRQVSMYRFEQDMHHSYRSSGELSTEKINSLWRTRQTSMFKDSVRLNQDYDWWWSYVSHFIHTPFYVYAYAFGELLTLAMYGLYKQNPASFVPKYETMLASGGSKSPKDLLNPFGINLESKEFWAAGVKIIQQMVKDIKKLA